MVDKAEFAAWYVDRMESDKRMNDDWRNADLNKDGMVTYEEYKTSRIAMTVPMQLACPPGFVPGPSDTTCKAAALKRSDIAKALFQRMDRDGDAKVSRKEFLSYRHPDEHMAADVDGDGEVTLKEFVNAPLHYHSSKKHSWEAKKAEFKSVDRNGDGKVTRQEFESQMRINKIHAIHGHHTRSEETYESQWVSWNEPALSSITHSHESNENVDVNVEADSTSHVAADQAQLRKEARSPAYTGAGLSKDDVLEL